MIGGGIAGLAAAWELCAGPGRGDENVPADVDVSVFEPGRLGGCIRTTDFAGHLVDEGPDAFLTRVPEAVQLCQELGIDSELVAPSAGRSLLWWRGRLRPLPDGLVLGVPRQLGPLLSSGILSPAGMARAALDLVLPRGRPPSTLTVRELVAGRFGAEVADRLVDPLVGGIHAGSTRQLGAAEVVPQLVATASRSRSLLFGLRDGGGPAPGAGGAREGVVFLAPRGGMSRLVDALVESLRTRGVRFLAQEAAAVRAGPGGAVMVDPDPDPFDAAVVATPARVAAALLEPGAVRQGLAAIPTASVAVVTVALSDARLPPGVNGFLVPQESGRLMTACSFASSKWPQWTHPGQALVRLSSGRFGHERPLELDDAELTDRLLAELEAALGSGLHPVASRVSRWPNTFPQYFVGHGRRVDDIEARLGELLPGVTLAGASYRGSGIPACIGSGRRAARLAIQRSGTHAR